MKRSAVLGYRVGLRSIHTRPEFNWRPSAQRLWFAIRNDFRVHTVTWCPKLQRESCRKINRSDWRDMCLTKCLTKRLPSRGFTRRRWWCWIALRGTSYQLHLACLLLATQREEEEHILMAWYEATCNLGSDLWAEHIHDGKYWWFLVFFNSFPFDSALCRTNGEDFWCCAHCIFEGAKIMEHCRFHESRSSKQRASRRMTRSSCIRKNNLKPD